MLSGVFLKQEDKIMEQMLFELELLPEDEVIVTGLPKYCSFTCLITGN